MGASIVAGADPSPVFDAAEHVLDAMALPVELLVVGYRDPPAARRGNARRDAALYQSGAKVVAVVACDSAWMVASFDVVAAVAKSTFEAELRATGEAERQAAERLAKVDDRAAGLPAAAPRPDLNSATLARVAAEGATAAAQRTAAWVAAREPARREPYAPPPPAGGLSLAPASGGAPARPTALAATPPMKVIMAEPGRATPVEAVREELSGRKARDEEPLPAAPKAPPAEAAKPTAPMPADAEAIEEPRGEKRAGERSSRGAIGEGREDSAVLVDY